MTSSSKGNGHPTRQHEVALARSEMRQTLSRARTARQKLEAIISSPHSEAIVPALPAEELYFMIKELGLSDATELVHLASPEQFRTFVDLEAWERDHLDSSAALLWLRAARTDDRSERFRRKVATMDIEVVELLLKGALHIWDLEEDPDPEPQGTTWRSPEGRYLVEFTVEGADYLGIRGLLDEMYADDAFLAARMLEAVRWELTTELEETAFRWRSGRLADLGFPGLEEALSFFAYTDPDAALPSLEEAPSIPGAYLLARLPSTGRFFEKAAQLVPDAERELVERQLVTALNAVMVAESVPPGDLDRVQEALAAARDTLSLGLEHASGGDPARAAALLTGVPIKRLFQVGVSLVLQLKFRADRLAKAGRLSFPSAPQALLLDAPGGEVLAALRRKRPLYCEAADDPSAPPERLRAFRDRADLARVGQVVGEAEKLTEVLEKLGLALAGAELAFTQARGGETLAFLRFSDLVLTASAREAVLGGFEFAPLPEGRLEAFLGAALGAADGAPAVAPAFEARLRSRLEAAARGLSAEHERVARDFAGLCLARLREEVGGPFQANGGRLDASIPLPVVVSPG